MKFLLVSPFTNASGSSVRFWNMAKAIANRGHRVVLAERSVKGGTPLHCCEGIVYCSCPSSGIQLPDMVISLIFNFVLLLRHSDCDIFYALKPAPNNCLPALAAKAAGKKVILDVDDLDYAYLAPGPGRELFRWFFNRFPRFFHLVTYHTPRLADYLREHARVPDDKLYYFAQGVSPEFIESGVSDPASVPPRSVIYVATLGITSDFGDVLSGFGALCTEYSDLSISIVGDGCRRAEFEQTAAERGIARNVTFTGTLPHRELPAVMARHRIGINYMRPSAVNQCRAILKIREYLACGLEVVCNDVGDVDLFHGYIHVAATIDGMFAVMRRLLGSPRGNAAAGRDHIIRNYQWSTITGAFLDRISRV